MGNTGMSRDMGDKGKNPSPLHISFPTKKLPSISSMAFIYLFFFPRNAWFKRLHFTTFEYGTIIWVSLSQEIY